MDKKKMLFVYNPKAGKEKIRSNLLDMIDTFVKAGYEVTVYPTQFSGDAVKAVTQRSMGYYDMLVCCGGDGTLDEVVTGMMQCEEKIPIGYVPAGTTNDFAGSLHIPRKMSSAAEVVVGGRIFPCDIGTFNDDYFVYIAAFGLFTEVSYATRQDMKNVLGHMAYLLEGVKSLSNIKSYRLHLESKELDMEDEFLYGMITNSISVGGFKNITGKKVHLDDGEFEVTLIKKPSNPLELNQIMASLLTKSITSENIYCFKTKELIITAKEELSWTLDGEFGGNHRHIHIRNEQKALQIMVPWESWKG